MGFWILDQKNVKIANKKKLSNAKNSMMVKLMHHLEVHFFTNLGMRNLMVTFLKFLDPRKISPGCHEHIFPLLDTTYMVKNYVIIFVKIPIHMLLCPEKIIGLWPFYKKLWIFEISKFSNFEGLVCGHSSLGKNLNYFFRTLLVKPDKIRLLSDFIPKLCQNQTLWSMWNGRKKYFFSRVKTRKCTKLHHSGVSKF